LPEAFLLAEPDGHTAIGAVQSTEYGFPIRYVSDQDGVRWLTIGPSDADMTGWSVEVGIDTEWYRQRDLVAPDGEGTEIEVFRRISLWGIGERWCVPIDWGQRAARWIPAFRWAVSASALHPRTSRTAGRAAIFPDVD
jgi:hypothetical protein